MDTSARTQEWIEFYAVKTVDELISLTLNLRNAVKWGHATEADTRFAVLENEQRRRSIG